MGVITTYAVKLVREESHRYEVSTRVTSPLDMHRVCREVLELHEQAEEVMALLMFNAKLNVTGVCEVSRGHLSASLVHPREILKRALLGNAHAIAIAHNHPSGDTTPSKEDIQITKRIQDACEIMGIHLLDHIIVGDYSEFVSLKNEGYL